mmetsp:Transcript_5409/g.10314  ORF Transcript_5409/g.10314 Transcript_5409/m.10314 type:complete len:310 (-) Transcript_5409:333-1262(-)
MRWCSSLRWACGLYELTKPSVKFNWVCLVNIIVSGTLHKIRRMLFVLRPLGQQVFRMRHINHSIVGSVHDVHLGLNIRYLFHVGEQIAATEDTGWCTHAIVVGDDPDACYHGAVQNQTAHGLARSQVAAGTCAYALPIKNYVVRRINSKGLDVVVHRLNISVCVPLAWHAGACAVPGVVIREDVGAQRVRHFHPVVKNDSTIHCIPMAEHDAARGLGYAEGEDGDALPEGGGEQLHVRAHRGQVAAPRDAHVQPHLGVARVVHVEVVGRRLRREERELRADFPGAAPGGTPEACKHTGQSTAHAVDGER